MKQYSSYWPITICTAIILHIFVYVGFILILPYLVPKPKSEEIAEMAWVDVELIEDKSVIIEEAQPVETTSESKFEIPKYEFPPIIMPDFPNEPTYVEEISPPPEPQPIPKRKPLPERQPVILKDEAEVLDQLERAPRKDVVIENNKSNQKMGQPPATITESYPTGNGFKYKGYVIVLVTIGTDGKVKESKIINPSGEMTIDNIAMNAAREWTFKPALDQDGKPMECDKIITFDFKKFDDDNL